ncbi:hypothetical protein PTSG_05371 [Salpingoeca rosetta]|uniref:Calponin-homology (CH) domain-containing protein n=1 Tax=Salpingoeca rosetta (strain ATCC 50818 / BSB-021) TaxID=946362 RepID=F2UA84_SALR5|nr:uncharacterized protein PTSG_05371 [Salpingoeca rosetta]EGD73659.1 hypothetical protein PTSG_05371 [Salpingoeca rosetta]|eukprot:XP_004993940.1 hypothetical protein PTSG_05371 [Salpingoeca rosetta]
MSALPREVWRWLQSLQLSIQVRNVRRDVANGYVIAEILSRYFPTKVKMHNYDKGSAIEKKMDNWRLLQKVFQTEGIEVDPKFINGCIHCKPGAAEPIITTLYKALTHRKCAIKTNLKPTELVSDPDLESTTTKVNEIIAKQQQLKRFDKETDPWRYGVNPPRATGHRIRPPTRGSSSGSS